MNLEDRVTRLERLTRRPRRPKPWQMLVTMVLMFAPIYAVYFFKRFMFPNTPTIYILLGVFPFVVVGLVIIVRINKPPPPGCCATCGYDLTGNVSGKCPECGTAIDAN